MLREQPARKVGAVVVDKNWFFTLLFVLCLPGLIIAQDVPQNEIQANMSGYADNFGVVVLYPNFSITRKVSDGTSFNGRFLVDAVSAASTKSRFEVDGVTSATSRENGGADNTPDDLRFQFGGGVNHNFGDRTAVLNLLYSTEHDYTSTTITGNFIQPLAQNNTIVQVGFVRSMDKVFPQTRFWKRDLNVTTATFQITQNLTPRTVVQAIYSHTKNSGHLSDNYQVVTVPTTTDVVYMEPIHPNSRIRRAAATRLNYHIFTRSSVQLGYRYYWDDWEVKGHTISTLFQTYIRDESIIGVGIRTHQQSKAEFFKKSYTIDDELRTVDPKLDGASAVDLQLKLSFPKFPFVKWLPANENLKYQFALNWYRRETDSADWHSRLKTLYAYNFNFGVRYHY